MNIFSYSDPRTAFIFNHPNPIQDSENCICFVSTGLETVPSVIFMKIRRVYPCLADCTGLFTFKGIHIFGSAGASTIQYNLKTVVQLGSSDCRQWIPPSQCAPGGCSQPENFHTAKSSSTGCAASPQDISGKALLPS